MADLLNIGATATELYRQAFSTVSNNIANLNSDGYSRQEVRAEETIPTKMGVDYLGSGVASKGVFRAFNESEFIWYRLIFYYFYIHSIAPAIAVISAVKLSTAIWQIFPFFFPTFFI